MDNDPRIAFISAFDAFENKIYPLEKYFSTFTKNIFFISSDFDHRTKKNLKPINDFHFLIKTIPYYQNFSLKRIFSHIFFSVKAISLAKKLDLDVVYIFIPPNFLSLLSSFFLSKKTKVIFDISDLWPETFPKNKTIFHKFIFKYWKKIRDFGMKRAYYLNFECDMFRNRFFEYSKKSSTLYPMKKQSFFYPEVSSNLNVIHIAYLGGINNIIDIEKIILILSTLAKHIKIKISIVGDGNSREYFLRELKKNSIEFMFHGLIFDENIKFDLIGSCDFGLNIMKSSVCVGLTLKSIEYSSYGIPIINNINFDNAFLINTYLSGINLSSNIESDALKILDIKKNSLNLYRNNSYKMYLENFSPNAFEHNCKKIFRNLF